MLERITVEPGKLGGKPCIRKMRIPAYLVLQMLASGMSEDEILDDYPGLEPEDIEAVLRYAAALLEGSPRSKRIEWPMLTDAEVEADEVPDGYGDLTEVELPLASARA